MRSRKARTINDKKKYQHKSRWREKCNVNIVKQKKTFFSLMSEYFSKFTESNLNLNSDNLMEKVLISKKYDPTYMMVLAGARSGPCNRS